MLNKPLTQSALRTDRILQGLTPMQEAYCQARASGLKPGEAYREAYNPTNALAATVSNAAWTMERRADIVERVGQLIAAAAGQTPLAPVLSRDFVVHHLVRLATTAERESVQATALIALGKVTGIDLFREIHVTEKRTRTQDEIDAELKDRLAVLARTIDVTPAIEGASLEQTITRLQADDDVTKPVDRRRKPRGSARPAK